MRRRESNYRFSYDKMLSLTGNTAPYMLYAYVRIKGIQRKAVESLTSTSSEGGIMTEIKNSDVLISWKEPEELALAKHMMRFQEVLREIESDLYPNKVSN